VLALLRPAAIGPGDAKLALATGLVLGWLGLRAAFTGLVAATLVGAVIGLALLAVGRIRLREPYPHGPAIPIGALLAHLTAPTPGLMTG
jgi:leader peptidase (prepilin peptidase)/N-methyltransferase